MNSIDFGLVLNLTPRPETLTTCSTAASGKPKRSCGRLTVPPLAVESSGV